MTSTIFNIKTNLSPKTNNNYHYIKLYMSHLLQKIMMIDDHNVAGIMYGLKFILGLTLTILRFYTAQ